MIHVLIITIRLYLKHFQASLTQAVEQKALEDEDEALAFLLEEEDREKERLRAATTTTTNCGKKLHEVVAYTYS